MATCYPCGHTVDEATSPYWSYKGMTFYFCSPGCEETVKGEPEKWLAVAKGGSAQQAHHHEPGHTH